ncbi:MAG TPA: aminotransferase class I/II-fold pyridoxal phosphate-dependent enzyme [Candidatus Deferrimicrobium sp.]|nr:aminotransferase class I/II-fold pyridoxal phosphate-dependent enzyme [Candidatus Deferrimicrobium sp.]
MNPSSFISPIVQALPSSGIRKFFDLVAETKGVISLGVGEPDFVTPWHVREACVYSLEKGYTMYTSNYGLLELREEISKYLTNSFRVTYEPRSEIMVTVGASEGVDLAMRALLCPGDEVLIPDPSYVSYMPCVVLAGGKAVPIPTRVEDEFKLDPEILESLITPRTKVLVLCYPNNPTGAIMTEAELLEIAKIAERHNLIVVSDEIYAELTYDGTPVSFAALPGMKERTVLLSGFSKSFAMTGWRIGYIATNPEFLAAMVKIHQYTILCAPVMGQMAALEALRNGSGEKDRMVNTYDQRRRLVINSLREMGLACFEPKGAFYAFPSIKETGLSSEEFAEKLLVEAKVAVVPGTAFGPSGEGHIRCSYAYSTVQLKEALGRIAEFVAKL